MCRYGECLILIDGTHRVILSFNILTKQFSDQWPVKIPKFGSGCNALVIGNTLHIMNGLSNQQNKYTIISMTNYKVKTFLNAMSPHTIGYVASCHLTKQSNQEMFYLFGGLDLSMQSNQRISSFYSGSKPSKPDSPIIWKQSHHYALPLGLDGFGSIHYGSFILIFGGTTNHHQNSDDIYISDLKQKETGWIRSKLKCPLKSDYVAVLDQQMNVHLFTRLREKADHFCIALCQLLPDLKEDLNGNLKESDQSELDLLKHKVNALESENETLRAQLNNLNSVEMNVMVNSLQSELERVKKENMTYQEEQKESQMRIAEPENEVKALKLKALDPSEFVEWDTETVLTWILSLEDGRFKPYANVLRHNLMEEKVRGSHFKDTEEGDVKGWGVKPFDDKKALIRHIRNVVDQYGNSVVAVAATTMKEGGATALL